tara:strand:- start:7338 stop:8003 length:666 start_codon:yes stop_codon:yes gene_type:complete
MFLNLKVALIIISSTEQMNDIKFSIKLNKKIFHDLINPTAAALNGLELLKDDMIQHNPDILDKEIIALIDKSINKISCQIQIMRFAYSDPLNKFDEIDLLEFEGLISNYLSHTKLKLKEVYKGIPINKSKAIIIANLILLIVDLFPIGGEILFGTKGSNVYIKGTPKDKKINTVLANLIENKVHEEYKENIQYSYIKSLLNLMGIKLIFNISDETLLIEEE